MKYFDHLDKLQSQFPEVDDGEIRNMDTRIAELSTQCKEKDEGVRRLDTGIHIYIYIFSLLLIH